LRGLIASIRMWRDDPKEGGFEGYFGLRMLVVDFSDEG
jgi:hypothetical protein